MPKQGPFPSKEADLSLYFVFVVPYLIANAERLNVSNENIPLLTQYLERWNTIFPQSQNINARTKTIVENKDIAKEDLIRLLRKIFGDIPQSALTTEDRNGLGLEARSTTKTPAPVPTSHPVGQVNTGNRLEHSISFTDEDGSHGKPEKVRGCQIWFKMGEPAKDISELSYVATDTASPYVHKFAVADVGKTVHYWLRWENPRGETGPWSPVVTATVTG